MTQKQVSRARTSNDIPQYLWDVITCPCPRNLLLAQHSSVYGGFKWWVMYLPILFISASWALWYTRHCLSASGVTMKVLHYNDVIMSTMASQITSLTIVYSTTYSGPDQRKHQSSALLAFMWWIHRWPVNSPHKGPVSPHKGPVTHKMLPFDDVIMGWNSPVTSHNKTQQSVKRVNDCSVQTTTCE